MDQQLRDFVFDRFGDAHAARPCIDYPLWSRVDNDQAGPAATLGYRGATEGALFLESYLDDRIERVVSHAFGRTIPRGDIVEIGCLAAVPSLALVRLWCQTAEGLLQSHAVAVATVTRPLRSMFARVGMPLVEIASADPARIGDAGGWGRYYDLDPVICAGDIRAGAEALAAYTARGSRR